MPPGISGRRHLVFLGQIAGDNVLDGGYSCRFVLVSTELALHRLIVSDDWVLTLLFGISCHIEPASNGHERYSLHLLLPF